MSRITLRLPDDMHRRLREISRQTGASLNQVIVAALHEAAAKTGDDRALTSREEELRRIRLALGDLVVEFDPSEFPPHLRPRDDLPGRDEFRRSMPRLVPPLSATVIEDREDRV